MREVTKAEYSMFLNTLKWQGATEKRIMQGKRYYTEVVSEMGQEVATRTQSLSRGKVVSEICLIKQGE